MRNSPAAQGAQQQNEQQSCRPNDHAALREKVRQANKDSETASQLRGGR